MKSVGTGATFRVGVTMGIDTSICVSVVMPSVTIASGFYIAVVCAMVNCEI